jgi:hypothetical protein
MKVAFMAANFTDAEKLEVIESFIVQWKVARTGDHLGGHDVYLLLKEIAKDYRGRAPNAPGRARERLERALEHAAKTKTGGVGYEFNALRRIAETVISEWPTIRQALEKFEQETK